MIKLKDVTIPAIAGISALVILIFIFRGCGKPVVIDERQKIIDSLERVIAEKDMEISKLDEIVTDYAHKYDSTLDVNEELQDKGVKTIIKYKTVKVESDTAEILRVCDSLATEYEEFIFQTKETIKAADSLMTAQSDEIGAYKVQNQTLKKLVLNLEEKIDEQKKEIEKWRKLAKRRGRAIEW